MVGFTKVDNDILISSLWPDLTLRNVFLTALFMATPHELCEAASQLEVQSLKPTGWCVPPGWYGFVKAAGIAIINTAGITDIAAGMKALEDLGAKDPNSRTTDHDGRRLVRIQGGYIVLNFQRYRERDYTAAERSRRYREKKVREQKAVRSTNEAEEPV